ncbi:MAG: hypothetical protein CL920_20685 [Deltaproteobacteria bacterium]|nr:hypothetical protein [Deltaproteobacteria bacterium]MBU51111.1 hypothetical protein [Deltaproteobacteria bacterium]|tara:strand:+ start:4613 stop:5914 length:1302 start_codon:yes stop_codon:yes gene_type:complete
MTKQPPFSDVITLCRELVAIDSINPFAAYQRPDQSWHIEGQEDEIFAYCREWLERADCEVTMQDCGGGRFNLLAEKGTGEVSLLLYAHVDTVEVKDGWTREQALSCSSALRDVDGRTQEVLIGLGANDMKGGLAVLLRAIALYTPTHYKLKLALGCDEEFWSLGSQCLIESSFLDDVIGIIVPEVGESTVDPAPDVSLVTLGRCGRVEFVVDVPGSGGHGAEPEAEGRVNAITQASRIALAIESFSARLPALQPFEESPQKVKASALVTSLQGGTGTLSIPDKATLIVNRVLNSGETIDEAQRQLEDLIQSLYDDESLQTLSDGRRVSVSIRERPTPPMSPYLLSPSQPFIKEVLSVLRQHTPVELGMGLSVADENRFGGQARKPVLVLGPRGEDSHAPFEWVTKDSLIKLEALYLHILKHFDQISLDLPRSI